MQNNVARANFLTNNTTNNTFSTVATAVTEKPTNEKQQQKKKKAKSAMKTVNAKTKTKTKKKKKYVCRNRTAYNFFFKHQRHVIVEELRKASTSATTTNNNEEEQTLQQFQTVQEIEAYLLNVDSDAKINRRHVKTHGLIGLKELTQLIACRWKECDEETKDIYKQLAIRDELRYKYENREVIGQEERGRKGEENTHLSIGEDKY